MNAQTEIADELLDARPGGMPDVVPASSTDITISLDKVRGEIAAFDKINAGLAKLRKQHPADLVVDVTTPAGMKMAITARAAYREPRVALERARKSAKAPVLDLGRSIDKFAASIEEQLRIGESNYNDQIKVEEERKAREKKAAEEAEAARVQQIQGRIAFRFSSVPMRSTGKTVAELREIIANIEAEPIEEEDFAELTQVAVTARAVALQELYAIQDGATRLEAEAERQRTQAEENARKQAELRKQQEDFEAEQRAHREQVARELAERQAKEEAERRERAAELAAIQKAKDDLAAAQREEADRLAAIERKRLDEQAAEERRIADEEAAAKREEHLRAIREEAERESAERQAREAAANKAAEAENAARMKREKAQAAALRKAQKQAAMAPRLLAGIKELRQAAHNAWDTLDGELGDAIADADTLIAEAEAE